MLIFSKKANPKKFHLLKNVNSPAAIKIGEHTISNSYCEKLHGAKIDSQLHFNNLPETVIKKASQRYIFWLDFCFI